MFVRVLNMPAFLLAHHHSKNLRYQFFPTINTDDHTILQSDCMRGAPGHTNSKVVVLDAMFP